MQPVDIDFSQVEIKGSFRISRKDVNNIITKAPELLKSVKIMPHFSGLGPDGLQLSKIKQGSILQKAGVKSGDIVKSVNGMKLVTPYHIFQAYKKLKNEKEFKVNVERNNAPITLSYIIE